MRAEGIGARLYDARQQAGLTLRALAEKAGVGHATISDIEKGHYIPAADTLEKLADALELSPCWLGYGLGPRRLSSAAPP